MCDSLELFSYKVENIIFIYHLSENIKFIGKVTTN
jgi:hypothetical protein